MYPCGVLLKDAHLLAFEVVHICGYCPYVHVILDAFVHRLSLCAFAGVAMQDTSRFVGGNRDMASVLISHVGAFKGTLSERFRVEFDVQQST
jgi:hypothetical protein